MELKDKGTEYTCAKCKGVFNREISDEEAIEDYKNESYFDPGEEDLVLICNDCYQKLQNYIFGISSKEL